jgi:23S rRNA (adenine-N6)-dimethyltransferase
MPRRTQRRRALSQNFLHDQSVIAEVIGTLHPPPGTLVVDLGAGAGALTKPLARTNRVHAVELDPRWATHLRTHAKAWGDVTVHHGDALAASFPRERFHLVCNAPYHVGTKLVRRVLTDAHGLERGVFVLQLQTARRLAKDGRFAATWAPWFELRTHGRIPPRAFRPAPTVDSALLTIVPRAVPLLSPAAFADYDAFLTRVFTGRGDTLAKRVGDRRALKRAAIPSDATPSSVPPEVFARLYCRSTEDPRDLH